MGGSHNSSPPPPRHLANLWTVIPTATSTLWGTTALSLSPTLSHTQALTLTLSLRHSAMASGVAWDRDRHHHTNAHSPPLSQCRLTQTRLRLKKLRNPAVAVPQGLFKPQRSLGPPCTAWLAFPAMGPAANHLLIWLPRVVPWLEGCKVTAMAHQGRGKRKNELCCELQRNLDTACAQ